MKFIYTFFAIILTINLSMAQEATQPRVLNLDAVISQIEYPLEARSQAIEGNVTILVQVGPTGQVESYEVKNACDPLLKKAIEQVAEKLEFIPSIQSDGSTTPSSIEIPFKFRLDIS